MPAEITFPPKVRWSNEQPVDPEHAKSNTGVFQPQFIEALRTLTSSIPGLHVEAKHSTFREALVDNEDFRKNLMQFLLIATSTVSEITDKEKHPAIHGAATFIRNVIALNNIYGQLKEKFVVEGGTNMDTWKALVDAVSPGKPLPGRYVPPGITEQDVFLESVGIEQVVGETLYKLYDLGMTGGTIEVEHGYMMNRWKITSEFMYAPKVREASRDGEVTGVYLDDDPNKMYWLQVICVKVYTEWVNPFTKEKDGPKEYRFILHSAWHKPTNMRDDRTIPSMFITVLGMCRSDKDFPFIKVNPDELKQSILSMLGNMMKTLFSVFRFNAFNPETQRIVVAMNTMHEVPRQLRYSGPDSVHLMDDYDHIRDGIRNCIEKGKPRGYAFVGYPGTGKTIMMEQLTNEFLDVPSVYFSVASLMQVGDGVDGDTMSCIMETLSGLKGAGYKCAFLCCDDLDAVELAEKNANVTRLISLLDQIRMECMPTVIFMCTVNDPTSLHGTIIKRGCRIDEVVEVGLPSVDSLCRLINAFRDESDTTDYSNEQYHAALEKMVDMNFSFADLANVMSSMVIYYTPEASGYTPEQLADAVVKVGESRENAGKNYA